jgi:isopentenyl-diphosphate delta-isomerase
LDRIEAVCRVLSVPVVAKEVGCGLSAQAARQLLDVGISALDVAGAGGTSWSEVERHRARSSRQEQVAAQFADWGIPTAQSLRLVSGAVPGAPLIASGGIESGVDVAKCLALGADLVGLAWPLLRPAMHSCAQVIETVETVADALRTAMFCSALPDIAALQGTPYLEEV